MGKVLGQPIPEDEDTDDEVVGDDKSGTAPSEQAAKRPAVEA